MRRILLLVTAVGLAGSLSVAAAAPRTRLLVIVVVDQFRASYLTSFATHWRAGFKTLVADGANFRRAQYPYLHTDTCAGHATIATGTLPRTHGMIADRWWDRDARKEIVCTEDEASPTITYERPSKLGDSARALLAPTLGDQLRRQKPSARVVTLSLKAYSAIGLAGHGGDAVTWFDDIGGTFVTSVEYASAPVPAVKRFVEMFPYERELGSIWSLRDAPASYRNPDAGVGERPPTPWSGLFPHELKGQKGADAQFSNLWRRSPASDAYLGRLAVALIDAFGLGQRESTDFLGISFSATDLVGHLFGPESREVEDVAARLDDVLGALLAHLDEKVGRANYVLVLTADHGVAPIPSAANNSGRVAPEDVRERIDDTLRAGYGAQDKEPYVEWNYLGDMYLSPAVSRRLAADPPMVRAIQKAVSSIPGVDRLLYTPALSSPSSDPLVRSAAMSSVPARNGEFVTTLKRNWVFTGRVDVIAATHGTQHEYDQHVPLLLFGAGIRRGTYDAPAAPTDIAPTLAALAGVDLARTEGRVLREALLPDVQAARR